MALRPSALSLGEGGVLTIEWSDGLRMRYDVAELRRHCPCATCRTEASSPPGAEPAAAQPGLSIEKMSPVGNYAYKIRFSDGHELGIYTFEWLRELGEVEGTG